MEKRNFTRIPVRIEAYVNCHGKLFIASIENLSLNGICLRSSESLAEGDEAAIIFCLTGSMETLELPVSLPGKVVWSGAGMFSMQFQSMDLATFTQLRNIIAYSAGDAERIMHEFVDSLQLEDSEMLEAV